MGFAAIVAIVIALGIASQKQLTEIASDMDSLYKHPFTVSNAAKSINFHLVSMHRHMKDVVLAQNATQMEWAVTKVAQHERHALAEFAIIFERFLGEQEQINQTYQSFVDWQPIRNEVISLMRNGNQRDASEITTGKGATHVAKLNHEVSELVEFAYSKAELFHGRAIKRKEHALIVNSVFSGLAVILVMAFSVYVFRSLKEANKDRIRRNHLIDQHIMLATLDKSGNIIDASNALCRFLGCLKADLIGRPSRFFDNSENTEKLASDIFKIINTGQQWQGEIQHRADDGNIYWATSSILPNFDEHYNILNFTNILNDITNKKLSNVDKLTALPNRRSFDELLAQELRSAKRHSYNLSLAILDIDFFKKYNDCYGHPQGDAALKQVAQRLMACLKRPNDYIFRIGGEEFAFIFSRASTAESNNFLDILRKEIEALHIQHQESNVSNYLTISVGAYVLSPHETLSAHELYIAADKALYQAKVERNNVVTECESTQVLSKTG